MRGTATCILLLLTLSAATAASTHDQVQAAKATYIGAFELDGDANLFSVIGHPVGEAASRPFLAGTAAHVSAWHYSQRQVGGDNLPTVVVPNTEDPLGPEYTMTPYDMDNVGLEMLDFQEDYVLHAFGGAGFGSTAAGDLVTGVFDALAMVWLTKSGLGQDPPAVLGANDEDDFTTVSKPGPVLIHTTVDGGAYAVDLSGNFTLEITGMDLRLTDSDGSVDLTSGVHQEDSGVSLTVPGAAPGMVRVEFLRLEFRGAHLQLTVRDGAPQIESSFTGANGVFGSGMRLEEVDDLGASSLIPSGMHVVLTPRTGPDGAVIGVQEMPEAASGGSQPMAAVAAALPSMLLLGLPAVLAVIGLVFLLRREQLPATLSTVEALLERGEYRRAASLAGRILRYDPTREDALISRAVALNRSHRPARVVAEIGNHLKKHDPSDGVLHYVLGLSYLDLGDKLHGEDCLHEAVRRTPSLRPEVAARLGAPAPTSHHPLMEAHGYA